MYYSPEHGLTLGRVVEGNVIVAHSAVLLLEAAVLRIFIVEIAVSLHLYLAEILLPRESNGREILGVHSVGPVQILQTEVLQRAKIMRDT